TGGNGTQGNGTGNQSCGNTTGNNTGGSTGNTTGNSTGNVSCSPPPAAPPPPASRGAVGDPTQTLNPRLWVLRDPWIFDFLPVQSAAQIQEEAD
ncbi:MAG: hypothetical protein L3K09_04150, partial [Thermoplasmata archaeon]|nr:hypothetical protein [Thermoplasmata archaeon]